MGIILASQSPRRKELLRQMGIQQFSIIVSDADETITGDLAPYDAVQELSLRKARAVAEQAGPEDILIAADTIVVSGEGHIIGKPKSKADAFDILSSLSGVKHHVMTGVTVMQGDRVLTQCEVTAVTFRPLSPREIQNYISTGEPMDKAGAYGIQGLGALLVAGIEGDYFNVMGLPIQRLSRMLAQFGVDPLAMAAN